MTTPPDAMTRTYTTPKPMDATEYVPGPPVAGARPDMFNWFEYIAPPKRPKIDYKRARAKGRKPIKKQAEKVTP